MIEPINKIWHFGSYAFFPYRFGFITMFLLIVGAGYAFNQYDSVKSIIPRKNKIFSINDSYYFSYCRNYSNSLQ